MSDVLDEIIDRLPLSTLRLLETHCEPRHYFNGNIKVNNLLHNFQEIKNKQINRELKRKIFDVKSKTIENKNFLSKLKKEFESLRCLKKTPSNEDTVRAYTVKLKELEAEAKNLTKEADIDLVSLFNEIVMLNEEINDYRKRTSEAKKLYPFDEGFPLDVKEAEEVIEKVKESIKAFDKFIYSSHMEGHTPGKKITGE